MDMAFQSKAPFITINDSGGARIEEGIAALDGYVLPFLFLGLVPVNIFHSTSISTPYAPCTGLYSCFASGGGLLPDEERLTDFGKMLRSTSLDELPELVNILKGDMSIVGSTAS